MKCTMEGIGKKFSSLYFSLSRAPPNGCVLSSPTLAGPPGRLAPKQQHAGQSPACVRGSPVNAGQEEAVQWEGLGGQRVTKRPGWAGPPGAGECHRAVPLGPHPVTQGMRTPREGARPWASRLPAALPTGEGRVRPSGPKAAPGTSRYAAGLPGQGQEQLPEGHERLVRAVPEGRRAGGGSSRAIRFPFIVSVLFKRGKRLLLLSLRIFFQCPQRSSGQLNHRPL